MKEVSKFDELFRFSIISEEDAEMFEQFEKATAKKVRRRFKRFVDKLKKSEEESFRNLLDLLFRPEKRTPIVDTNPHLIGVKEVEGWTDFDMEMYFHMLGKGHNGTFEVNTYIYWIDYAIDYLDMFGSEAEELYDRNKEYLNNWEEYYIHKLAEEYGVEVKRVLFGWQVYYKSKNTIRFGTMAEAKD